MSQLSSRAALTRGHPTLFLFAVTGSSVIKSAKNRSAARHVHELFSRRLGTAPSPAKLSTQAACPLLTKPHDVLEDKINAWATVFGAPLVATWFARAPQLVLYSPTTARAKAEHLAELFQADIDDVLKLVSRQPGVLCCSAESLGAKVATCERLLGLQQPTDALKLFTKAPAILSVSEASLSERLAAISAALRLPVPAVAAMVVRQPQLLLLAPQSLADKLEAYQRIFELSRRDAAALIARYPNLLTRSSTALGQRWARLRQLAACDAAWSRQLGELSPASKAACLIRSDGDLDRLQFLLEQRAVLTSLVNILTTTKQKFAERHPEFASWQASKRPCKNVA